MWPVTSKLLVRVGFSCLLWLFKNALEKLSMGHLPTLTLRYSRKVGEGRVFSYSCRCPQAPKGLPEPGIWSEALKSKPSPAWGQVSLQLTARLHKSRWEQLPPTEPFPSSFLFDPIPPTALSRKELPSLESQRLQEGR